MRRIVVGVDGSEGGQRALDWAVAEAREHGGTIEAVAVVEWPPVSWSMPLEGVPVATVDLDVVEEQAEAWLSHAISKAKAADLVIERVITSGNAADRLVSIAEGADLLVVGSHGHGQLRSLLLGGVSHKVLHHAPCPVVMVPLPASE